MIRLLFFAGWVVVTAGEIYLEYREGQLRYSILRAWLEAHNQDHLKKAYEHGDWERRLQERKGLGACG